MAMCWRATGGEPVKYKRDLPPSHYSLKIQSFASLSTLEKYESGVFKAGGYRWSLCLYPNGNKDANGSGYISLYLSIEETDFPTPDRKVHVNYKLFVHDTLRNNHLTIQDADGAVRSFHGSKTQWGFPRFLSLKKFKKHSYGYLVNDSCTFGAEVFVIRPTRRTESLTLLNNPPNNTYDWKFQNWSTLGTHQYSPAFAIGGRIWKLLVYPKGEEDVKGKSLSVYLQVQDLPQRRKVCAKFHLRVRDQLNFNNKERDFDGWLSSSAPALGCKDFMSLRDLRNQAKGFVSNDALIVEVQIHATSSSTVSDL